MMLRWINKQPGRQKFWNLCSHYQAIYDWIPPLNKWSGLWFILTQQSMGSMVNPVTCLFSLLWSTQWCFWGAIFSSSGLHFYTLNRTSTRARTRCGQDAESNFVNPHSFRNLSAYSWTCPQPVLIPSGLLPRTLLQSIQREQWFLHLSADRMPKWHNLLPQPVLILSAL